MTLPKGSHGFMHKSHAMGKDEESKIDQFEPGHNLPKVRVKERNYFDGVVFLTLKQQLLESEALAFSDLKIG